MFESTLDSTFLAFALFVLGAAIAWKVL